MSKAQEKTARDAWAQVREVPVPLTPPWIKRFFKYEFGLSVLVSGTRNTGNSWVQVQIERKQTGAQFPESLAQLCLDVVYKKHDELREARQKRVPGPFAGNIAARLIALHNDEWRQVFTKILTDKEQ